MTDRPSTRERRLATTRRAIAENALRLFAENGYEATTVADIADAADMSTRTFFRHVRDKEDALFAADDDAFDTAEAAVAAADRSLTPLARLLAGVVALAAGEEENASAKCERERILDDNSVLRARDLVQQLRWQRQAEDLLVADGVPRAEAGVAAGLALTVWREGYRRWVAENGRGRLADHLRDVAAELPAAVRPVGNPGPAGEAHRGS